jgi:hypothetical protein
MKVIIIATLLLTLLCSCDEGIQKGWVYAHRVHPAYTSISPGHSTTTCTGVRIRTCRTTYYPPIIISHPETYEIDISDCTHNVQSSECKTNTLYVPKETYDQYPIGSYYGGN